MTSNQKTDEVGDSKTPTLQPNATGLRYGADQALSLQGDSPAQIKPMSPAASAASARQEGDDRPPTSCKQIVWQSFFFDGTGNNMDADVGTLKHSNVAKLYRVHQDDDQGKGIYRIYIPGVGTYFDKVGDDGGSTLGLGTGKMGDARLDWALSQFDEKMAYHIAHATSPESAIVEVNVSVFGFSRGAALARAFVNRLLSSRGRYAGTSWKMKNVDCPLRIRFMGLFDTVASVGVPMSKNNIAVVSSLIGLRAMINTRLTDPDYMEDRPNVLAFAKGGAPGADPAPGTFDGHMDWGGELAIPEMVEEVRHFVAAHEIRNSFPVDSVTIMRGDTPVKPGHFYESVYPGVHSDVGGSYRPGEGGRSVEPAEKLGLIPLNQMYEFALAGKVPLLANGAWKDFNRQDFDIGPKVLESYRYYWSKVAHVPILGTEMNAHMRLYYAWRFRAIHLKAQGDHKEADDIAHTGAEFDTERVQLQSTIKAREQDNDAALSQLRTAQNKRLNYLQGNYGNPDLTDLPSLDAQVQEASSKQAKTQDAMLREKAKLDALPDMSKLTSTIAMYDAQLLSDARSIRDAYTTKSFLSDAAPEQYGELRPHYKALIDAYEDEFIRNAGLKDHGIIDFFDNYVHDSLSGFAKDATLPSDPRVIYLGGDEKYKYALLQRKSGADAPTYANAEAPGKDSVVDAA